MAIKKKIKTNKILALLKKILIKHNDCIELIDNDDIFCEAKNNEKYSKINKLEGVNQNGKINELQYSRHLQ